MNAVAWQKLVRDKRAAEDADADMFGRWWRGINLDLASADVREVSYETARTIIEKYEWLGTMPAIARFTFGIFFDGCCGGVVVYGDEYAENLGVWDKYGFTGKIICLSRGACTHWSPVGTASRLIRQSMKMLPERYEVVTATTDALAGEIGTIYQACGFYCVEMNTNTRASMMVDGKRYGSRRLIQMFGSANKDIVLAKGGTHVVEHKKGRYFGFRGPKGAQRKHVRAIQHLIRPYPKRAGRPEDERAPTRESKVQPLGSAPPSRNRANCAGAAIGVSADSEGKT